MNNILLYITSILIWGTTWFAIKLQLGHASEEISILYRAVLATIALVLLCKVRGYSLKFRLKDHIFLLLLGLAMFSIHFIFVYNATKYIASGLVSVIFSAVSFLSVVNNFIFFKEKPKVKVLLGSVLGIMGLCVFFWTEIINAAHTDNAYLIEKGIMIAGIGTLIFSLGSTISKRNNKHGIAILPAMSVAMFYGMLAMLIYSLFSGAEFVIPSSFSYWASLLYLAFFGSIIAFICYMQLIKNIGPELASYTTVLFPVVALTVSSWLEGYKWNMEDFSGLTMILIGNILVITDPRKLANLITVKVKSFMAFVAK